MIIAERNLSDAEAGAAFGVIMGTVLILCMSFVLVMKVRQKYGVMPRGLRWVEILLPALWTRTKEFGVRVFYGDVLKKREAEKLRMERETGMTPWWDDNAMMWRRGDVEEVKNQYNYVIARRPHNYRNQAATTGETFKKGTSA